MNMLYVFGFILAVALVASAIPAKQCEGYDFDRFSERISVSPCQKTKCKLHKETNITVTLRFNPEEEVHTLDNEVYGIIGGFPLPFLGVTGTSACTSIYHEDGTPAPCPLKPNQEYVYSNVFYVEPLYPEVGLTVQWSLNSGSKKVICFEVPATIAKKKNAKVTRDI